MDTGPMPPPLPTAMALGLMAMPAPTPMVPTGISARGLLRLRLSPRLMLMLLTTALLATPVWDTPTTDTTATGPMLPLPTPGLLATPPLTPTTMVPTTISARGLLMLSLRPMLMLMPTTAPLATLVWDTPTTDTMDTGPMLPLPLATGLTAMPPPTPTTMVPTTISARGLLMLSLRPMLMLMLTTAPLATMVWDTPTTDSM